MNIDKLLSYQAEPLRYHLVIARKMPNSEFHMWNVGHSLVDTLIEERDSEYLAEVFAEKCRTLARQHSTQVAGISDVLIVSHYGILFEPTLQFDVDNFFRKLSQSYLVIILGDGLLQDDKLYLTQEPSDYFINLNEINYLVL